MRASRGGRLVEGRVMGRRAVVLGGSSCGRRASSWGLCTHVSSTVQRLPSGSLRLGAPRCRAACAWRRGRGCGRPTATPRNPPVSIP